MTTLLTREENPQLEETQTQEVNVKDLLEKKWAEGKFLCVGLDVTSEGSGVDLYEKARLIVDATRDVAAAYKPNSAFYESEVSLGFKQLERLTSYIKQLAPEIPIIWDAKRGDIEKTNEGYDRAADRLKADAITIQPYLGGTAVGPLLSNPKRAGFVLVHTSNSGASEFQDLQLKSGEKLWERVVANVAHSEDWQHGSAMGIVMGATYPEEIAKARHIAGNEVIILVPGIGTQGGDLDTSIRGAMNNRGDGFLINVSSKISGATNAAGEITFEAIRDSAISYNEQIREIWEDAIRNPQPTYAERQILEFNARLARTLLNEGCIKFTDTELSSGLKGPYIDLRRTMTDPTVRGNIAQIYVDKLKSLEDMRGEPFDVIGGVPQEVTSFASIVADRMNKRLVQPRAGARKDHGIPTLVEGKFNKGESIGLIEGTMTTGGSALAAIDQVEAAGLHFGGMAVLVDREQGGSRKMLERNREFVFSTTLKGIMLALDDMNELPPGQRDDILEYINTQTAN